MDAFAQHLIILVHAVSVLSDRFRKAQFLDIDTHTETLTHPKNGLRAADDIDSGFTFFPSIFFPFKIIYFDEDRELLETISAIFLSIGIALYPALLIAALKKAKRVEEQRVLPGLWSKWHKRKTNKKCILHKDDSREDDAKHKRQKKDGQAARHAANANSNAGSICASCGQSGHSNAASRKPNIKDRIIEKFGKDHERFTPEYQMQLKNAITQKSSWLGQVMLRASVVVYGYFISQSQNSIPTYIFGQNFWYSVCQLILCLPVSNTNTRFPSNFSGEHGFWASFWAPHPDIRYPLNVTGYSDILSAACKEIATAYPVQIGQVCACNAASYKNRHCGMLQRKEARGEIALVTISEYNTSQLHVKISEEATDGGRCYSPWHPGLPNLWNAVE
ncbi:hypothetical protein VTP01DRAFT_8096 [Rhizomucor pusillus]|uniref:uncharacterized protein n=1 Tax=Rhizomucor pusillus TaxID=4840 RepID=UPI0037434CCC